MKITEILCDCCGKVIKENSGGVFIRGVDENLNAIRCNSGRDFGSKVFRFGKKDYCSAECLFEHIRKVLALTI